MLASVLTASCGGGTGTGPAAPVLTLTAGDGRLVATWPSQPGLEYAIYYTGDPTTSSSTFQKSTYAGANLGITTPWILSKFNTNNPGALFLNGTQYSATMNARQGSSPAGGDAPSQAATPRLAGHFFTSGTDTSWQSLPAQPAQPVAGTRYQAAASTLRAVAVGPQQTVNNLLQAPYVAAGDSGTLRVSYDNGSSWQAATLSSTLPTIAQDNFTAAIPSAGSFLVAGCHATSGTCTSPLIYVSSSYDVSTATWSTLNGVPGSTATTFNGLAQSASGLVVAGDQGVLLFRSSSSGAWATPTVFAGQTWRAVACDASATNRCLAVGNGGAAAYSADGGQTWTLQTTGTTNNLNGVSFGIISNVANGVNTLTSQFVAVGDAGAALTVSFNASGQPVLTASAPFASSKMNAVTYGNLPCISNLTAYCVPGFQQFIAVGDAGVIYYSLDGSTGWTAVTGAPAANLNALVHTPDQSYRYYEYMAVGDGGTTLTAN